MNPLRRLITPFSRLGTFSRAHPLAVTVFFTLAVGAALAAGLWDKRDAFASSFGEAPLWVLGAATLMQVVWLVGRSEAWHVCVEAAGGSVERPRLYRASSIGYLGNMFNPHVGMGMRIAALRRSAPSDCPKASVLVAAEMPIIVVEIVLAALFSFTLIAPLDVAWWIPVSFFAIAIAGIVAATLTARGKTHGAWAGLGVLRGLRSRNTIIALVVFAVAAQAARNYLVLRGIGVDISIFDSIALLIGTALFGLLPVGPTLGVATAVIILGSNGVAAVAAAGALLTATGALGALIFAAWGIADGLARRRGRTRGADQRSRRPREAPLRTG